MYYAGMWNIFLTKDMDNLDNPIFTLRRAMNQSIFPGILCEAGQYP